MTDISQQIRGQICILKDLLYLKIVVMGQLLESNRKEWTPWHLDSMTYYMCYDIYRHTLFYYISLYCIFYKLKICSNFLWTKSINVIFPTSFSHVVSLCHIIVILAIFQTFSLLLICLLQWSVIINVTIMICWRFVEYYNLQLMVNIC